MKRFCSIDVLSVTTLNAATLISDSQLQNKTLITDLQDLLLQHPDFMQLLECLGKDREVGGLVRDLKTTFEALAELYAQLNSSDPDVEVLQHTQAKFRLAVRTFADHAPLCIPDEIL
jgi:predicted metal-dependent enzyme (double-stranded beta helix superfamily)